MLLAQSLHSLKHFNEIYKEKLCFHKTETGKSQITHSHHKFEECSFCQFSFGHSYLKTNFLTTTYQIIFVKKIQIDVVRPYVSFFSGSFFSLRAPPVLMFLQ